MAHVAPVAQGALTAGASLASPDAPGCGQLHVPQQLLPPQSWPRPQEGGDSAAAAVVAAVTAAAVMAAAVEERTSGVWVTPGWCPRTISLDASLQEVHALKLNGAEDARDVSSENGGTENLCREGFGSGSHAEASWAAGMFPCGSMEPPSLVAPCCWVGPCILQSDLQQSRVGPVKSSLTSPAIFWRNTGTTSTLSKNQKPYSSVHMSYRQWNNSTLCNQQHKVSVLIAQPVVNTLDVQGCKFQCQWMDRGIGWWVYVWMPWIVCHP